MVIDFVPFQVAVQPGRKIIPQISKFWCQVLFAKAVGPAFFGQT